MARGAMEEQAAGGAVLDGAEASGRGAPSGTRAEPDARVGDARVGMESLTDEQAAGVLDSVVNEEIRRVRRTATGGAPDSATGGADEVDDDGGEEREEGDDEDEDDREEEEEDEDDEDGEDGEARELSDDTVLTVGDSKVTLGELKERFGDGAGAATASERRELEDVRKEYEARNGDLAEAYSRIVEWVEKSIVPPEPSMELLTDNPKEYLVQKELRSTVLKRLNEIAEQRDALADKNAQTARKELAALRRVESEKLRRAFPELVSSSKNRQFQERVRETARTLGFNEDEISSTFDHRILMTIHFAGLGMAAERNRKAAARRPPEKARQGPRPGRVAGRTAPGRKSSAARVRLKKTGNLEDAADVLESMMGLQRR